MRAWCACFIREPIDERKQSWLLFSSDFDVIDCVAMLNEEQRLPHEDREEARTRTRHESPERIAPMHQSNEQTIARPAEPARKCEIQGHEQSETCHCKPGV